MPPYCNDEIPCEDQTYYCEWRFHNGMWENINAVVPYNYYCPQPPGTSSAGLVARSSPQLCLYPCPISSGRALGAYCQAT